MFNPQKAAYNLAISAVRTGLATAIALRKAIVASEPQTSGSSVTHLESALKSTFLARTFTGYEGDLESSENPFRAERTRRPRSGRTVSR